MDQVAMRFRRQFPKTIWQARRLVEVEKQGPTPTPTPIVKTKTLYTVRTPGANDDEQEAARLRKLRRQRDGYPAQAIPELWESGTHIERDYVRSTSDYVRQQA